MPVESIGTSFSNTQTNALQQTGLGQEDFLKIFLAQLSFQDPLEPVDNQQFMAQMAQFSSLDQTRQTNEKLDSLLVLQSANQSVALIGKTVEVATQSKTQIGEVTTVSFSSGEAQLTIKTEDGEYVTGVSLGQVSIVRNPSEE